jgi:hypothetical protein
MAEPFHCTLISDPDSEMVGYIFDFLKIGDEGGKSFDDWLAGARRYGKRDEENAGEPGCRRGWNHGQSEGTAGSFIGHEVGTEMEGWQQFVVHAIAGSRTRVAEQLLEGYLLDVNWRLSNLILRCWRNQCDRSEMRPREMA